MSMWIRATPIWASKESNLQMSSLTGETLVKLGTLVATRCLYGPDGARGALGKNESPKVFANQTENNNGENTVNLGLKR